MQAQALTVSLTFCQVELPFALACSAASCAVPTYSPAAARACPALSDATFWPYLTLAEAFDAASLALSCRSEAWSEAVPTT